MVEKPPRERPSAWLCWPLCPGRRDVGACGRAVEELDQMRALAVLGEQLKNTSNTPERFSRQNCFQILFHLPNSAGKARHVMLWAVK